MSTSPWPILARLHLIYHFTLSLLACRLPQLRSPQCLAGGGCWYFLLLPQVFASARVPLLGVAPRSVFSPGKPPPAPKDFSPEFSSKQQERAGSSSASTSPGDTREFFPSFALFIRFPFLFKGVTSSALPGQTREGSDGWLGFICSRLRSLARIRPDGRYRGREEREA